MQRFDADTPDGSLSPDGGKGDLLTRISEGLLQGQTFYSATGEGGNLALEALSLRLKIAENEV